MYCFQCQETARNQGCTVKGVCGKPEGTANLQDLLIYVCKGISVYGEKMAKQGTVDREAGRFIIKALFVTITNAAWDDDSIIEWIRTGLKVKDAIAQKAGASGALRRSPPPCRVSSTTRRAPLRWRPPRPPRIAACAASRACPSASSRASASPHRCSSSSVPPLSAVV